MLYTFEDLLGTSPKQHLSKKAQKQLDVVYVGCCEEVGWDEQEGGNFFFPETITFRWLVSRELVSLVASQHCKIVAESKDFLAF